MTVRLTCFTYTPEALVTNIKNGDSREAVAKAVNSGAIYKLLLKPWDNKELIDVVDNAIQHYDLEHKNKMLTLELENVNRKLQKVNSSLQEKAKKRKG